MAAAVRPYTLTALHPLFGAVITGLNLSKTPIDSIVIKQIREDTARYRLLIIKVTY